MFLVNLINEIPYLVLMAIVIQNWRFQLRKEFSLILIGAALNPIWHIINWIFPNITQTLIGLWEPIISYYNSFGFLCVTLGIIGLMQQYVSTRTDRSQPLLTKSIPAAFLSLGFYEIARALEQSGNQKQSSTWMPLIYFALMAWAVLVVSIGFVFFGFGNNETIDSSSHQVIIASCLFLIAAFSLRSFQQFSNNTSLN